MEDSRQDLEGRRCWANFRSFVTAFLVATGVTVSWRGLWVLLDVVEVEAVPCLLLATGLLLLHFILHSCNLVPGRRGGNGGLSLALAAARYVYSLFLFFVTVAFWRGIWYCADDAVAGVSAALGCYLCILIGLALLGTLHSTHSALAAPIVVWEKVVSGESSELWKEQYFSPPDIPALPNQRWYCWQSPSSSEADTAREPHGFSLSRPGGMGL